MRGLVAVARGGVLVRGRSVGAGRGGRGVEGVEALRLGVEAGDVAAVRDMLRGGLGGAVDVNAGSGPRGETPLVAAVSRGDVEITEMLLARADVNPRAACGDERTTAMHAAAWYGHTVLLAKLLAAAAARAGGFNVNVRDGGGASPLARAAGNGRLHATEMLADHPQVDLNSVDREGRTPLALAAEAGHLAVVKRLVDLPEVDLNHPTHDGLTPEVLAERNGHCDVARVLLDAGAIVGEP